MKLANVIIVNNNNLPPWSCFVPSFSCWPWKERIKCKVTKMKKPENQSNFAPHLLRPKEKAPASPSPHHMPLKGREKMRKRKERKFSLWNLTYSLECYDHWAHIKHHKPTLHEYLFNIAPLTLIICLPNSLDHCCPHFVVILLSLLSQTKTWYCYQSSLLWLNNFRSMTAFYLCLKSWQDVHWRKSHYHHLTIMRLKYRTNHKYVSSLHSRGRNVTLQNRWK